MPEPRRAAGEPGIPTGFHIVNQEHRLVPTTGGAIDGEWTIHFVTPSGIESQIQIPARMYNRDTVGHMIADEVHKIESVHRLTERPETPAPVQG